jgi:ABC-type maltose transport system permease subunit
MAKVQNTGEKIPLNQWQLAARKAEKTAKILRVLLWTVLLVGVVLSLTPFYIMFVMSLKSAGELAGSSPWALPKEWAWANYGKVPEHTICSICCYLRRHVELKHRRVCICKAQVCRTRSFVHSSPQYDDAPGSRNDDSSVCALEKSRVD